MKIVTSLLEEISGISIFPMISMFLFLTFFAGILIYTFRLDGQLSEQMRHMPLDGDENSMNNNDYLQ
jgi:cytochrome c oxidase cbb3-type subunit IV